MSNNYDHDNAGTSGNMGSQIGIPSGYPLPSAMTPLGAIIQNAHAKVASQNQSEDTFTAQTESGYIEVAPDEVNYGG